MFDLDGGRPCLDFANTLSATTGEHLTGYADLVAFADESSLLTPQDVVWLHAAARPDSAASEQVMQRAYALRRAIYAVFSAIAARELPPAGDLDALNAELAAAMAHTTLTPDGRGGFRWDWQGRALDMPLWGVARSAAELLVADDERRRVRECGGLDCRWLFLDTSKNRSRQWCSMQSCGNRQKARRHYQRVRARATAE